MIWTRLGNSMLQARIGPKTITRLESILGALDERDGVDIYQLANLARIFHAFVGIDLLKNAEFRTELLNRLPPETLRTVATATAVRFVQEDFGGTVQRIVAKGWRCETFTRQFLDALGLGECFVTVGSEVFDPVIRFDPCERPYKPLKDYQFEVFCDAMRELANPFARFLIQMPTGSGKTRTAMEFLCEVLNASQEDSLVVWIAHSEELCSQAVECFSDVWSHVGRHRLDCYRCWGSDGDLPIAPSGRGVVFGGFQRLHSIHKRDSNRITNLSKRVRLVVVDEAHKVTAPTYKSVADAFLGNAGKLVGLTATPGRSATEASENLKLASYFHDHIVRLHEADGVSAIEMLRRKRVLSRLVSDPLHSRRSYALSKKDREFVAESFDLPAGVLSKIADDDVRNVEIIQRLLKECNQGKKIIFFGCNIEHSRFICALLVYYGIKAAHVDGKTGSMRRRHTIESFKNGDTQVICNFGILTTGFDAPKTDVVFIARPTASVVLYSQMIGRGLRGPLLGGTETCVLIDVRDNIEGFEGQTELYEYFDEYWTAR